MKTNQDGRATATIRCATGQAGIIQLERDKVIRLEKDLAVKRLQVKSGLVWLTSTPARGDVLLPAGAQFELSDDWPFVFQALEPAEVILHFSLQDIRNGHETEVEYHNLEMARLTSAINPQINLVRTEGYAAKDADIGTI